MHKNSKYSKRLYKLYDRAKPKPSIFNCPKYKKIEYPREKSEAEIQAILWRRLKRCGLDARLEVSSLMEKGKTESRFDIVVFYEREAFCIVEVKKDSRLYKRGIQRIADEKQVKKYSKYDAELFFCVGDGMLDATFNKVKELADELYGSIV